MRLLLFLCFVGLASAVDLLQQAAPALDENVEAFLQGAASAGALSKALGIDDPQLDGLAEDLERDLGEKVREALREMLQKIADHVDNGEKVAVELFNKVKELKSKLVDGTDDKAKEMLGKVREKAREALKKILERLGLGKRNLDDSMDQMARQKFRDLVDLIHEKIISKENIQKIRDYFRNYPGNNPFVEAVRKMVEQLSDADLVKLLKELFDGGKGLQLRGETWDRLKKFFKDLNVKIQEHSRKFGEWVQDMWGKGLDKLKDKYGTIKAIAMEFISHSKDMSAEMSREALEFFRPYKEDLGSLWGKLVDATKEAIGKF